MNRFRIKICGVTRPQDAVLAATLGVDLIGVIFYTGSPRVVTMQQAKAILDPLPPMVHRVGVFVHDTANSIIKRASLLHLDFVQLHGAQTESDIRAVRAAGFKVIKAFDGNTTRTPRTAADIVMFDNQSEGELGGTGRQFDWPARPRKATPNLMLAGGINAQNVEEGVRLFRPLIVDVNSSVESAPGIKSKVKLTRFMRVCDRIRYGC